ncbi:MAG: hypothetical protein DRP81_08430, partial [Candidatus Omnitrophota bacterium]
TPTELQDIINEDRAEQHNLIRTYLGEEIFEKQKEYEEVVRGEGEDLLLTLVPVDSPVWNEPKIKSIEEIYGLGYHYLDYMRDLSIQDDYYMNLRVIPSLSSSLGKPTKFDSGPEEGFIRLITDEALFNAAEITADKGLDLRKFGILYDRVKYLHNDYVPSWIAGSMDCGTVVNPALILFLRDFHPNIAEQYLNDMLTLSVSEGEISGFYHKSVERPMKFDLFHKIWEAEDHLKRIQAERDTEEDSLTLLASDAIFRHEVLKGISSALILRIEEIILEEWLRLINENKVFPGLLLLRVLKSKGSFSIYEEEILREWLFHKFALYLDSNSVYRRLGYDKLRQEEEQFFEKVIKILVKLKYFDSQGIRIKSKEWVVKGDPRTEPDEDYYIYHYDIKQTAELLPEEKKKVLSIMGRGDGSQEILLALEGHSVIGLSPYSSQVKRAKDIRDILVLPEYAVRKGILRIAEKGCYFRFPKKKRGGSDWQSSRKTYSPDEIENAVKNVVFLDGTIGEKTEESRRIFENLKNIFGQFDAIILTDIDRTETSVDMERFVEEFNLVGKDGEPLKSGQIPRSTKDMIDPLSLLEDINLLLKNKGEVIFVIPRYRIDEQTLVYITQEGTDFHSHWIKPPQQRQEWDKPDEVWQVWQDILDKEEGLLLDFTHLAKAMGFEVIADVIGPDKNLYLILQKVSPKITLFWDDFLLYGTKADSEGVRKFLQMAIDKYYDYAKEIMQLSAYPLRAYILKHLDTIEKYQNKARMISKLEQLPKLVAESLFWLQGAQYATKEEWENELPIYIERVDDLIKGKNEDTTEEILQTLTAISDIARIYELENSFEDLIRKVENEAGNLDNSSYAKEFLHAFLAASDMGKFYTLEGDIGNAIKCYEKALIVIRKLERTNPDDYKKVFPIISPEIGEIKKTLSNFREGKIDKIEFADPWIEVVSKIRSKIKHSKSIFNKAASGSLKTLGIPTTKEDKEAFKQAKQKESLWLRQADKLPLETR